MKNFYALLFFLPFIFISLGIEKVSAQVQDTTICPNSNFNQGNFNDWRGCYGYFSNPCIEQGFLTNGAHPLHKIIHSPGWHDHNTCDTLLNVFPGDSYVARIGDTMYTGTQHGQYKEAELKYNVDVTSTSYLFIYRYAPVLQTGGHPNGWQPDFRVEVTDSTGQLLDSCGYFYFAAPTSGPASNGWHLCTNNPDGNVYWKNWTTVGMDLSSWFGQTVTIDFRARGCTYDTHFGYAYVSAFCSYLAVRTALCQGDSSAMLIAPPGFRYLWSNSDTTDTIIVPHPITGQIYSCTLTALNGCQVTISDTLTYTVITTNFYYGPACSGIITQFYDSSYVNQNAVTGWIWNFGDGTPLVTGIQNPAHIFAFPGTYNVKLISNSTEGCKDSITKAVTVTHSPTATIAGTIAVCANSTPPLITFTGSSSAPPYTFTYNINGGPDQQVTASGGNSVTVAAPTNVTGTFTYTLISVQAGSCTQPETGSAVVTVNPLPTATISGTTAVCQNSASPLITFTGGSSTAPYTFTYNINGGANQQVTTVAGNSVTVAAPTDVAGIFTYNLVSVQDGSATACSQSQTGSAVVTVYPLPTATISGTIAVCQNSAAPLITFTGDSSTPPYTFTYNINGGANQQVTTSGGNSVTVAAPTSSVGTFNYNLISVQDGSPLACSQSQSGSAVVTVNPLPTATISGTITVCQNATAPLITFTGGSSTPPYTFTYNINGGANQQVTTAAGNSVTVAVPTNVVGTFIYNLISVQDGSATACSQIQTGSATVTINSLPVPTISGPSSVCLNSSVIYFTEAGMNNYTWSVSAGGSITSGTGTSSITILWSTIGSKTITVNYFNANGCTAASPTSYSVTVNTLPNPSLNGSNDTCVNTSITYTTDEGMNNYSWAVSSGGSITAGGGSSDYFVTVLWNTAGAQTVSVNYYMSSGCTAPAPTVLNVTVKPRPAITNAGNPALCSNGTTNIVFISTLPGTTYTWTATGSSGNVTGYSNGSGSSIIQTLLNTGYNIETVNYAVIPSLNGCDGAVTHYIVTVNPVADVYFNPNGQTFCSGNTTSIALLSHVTGTTFTWTATGSSGNISGFGPGNGNQISQTLIDSGPYVENVNYDVFPLANSCAGTDNHVIVTVDPKPQVIFTPCNSVITTTDAKPFTLKGGNPLGGVYSGPGVNAGIFYPSLAGTGNITINYSYINTWGCNASMSQIITVVNAIPFNCNNMLTDIRDNHTYPTVKLGTQCWMAANLNYGTIIPSTAMQRDNCVSEKYCYSDNAANCTSYGGLYQWDELMQYDNTAADQGFCPPAWHIPTNNDWNTLFLFYVSNGFAGNPLKYTGYSGFDAFLSGTRFNNVSWNFSNFAVMFWTSTMEGPQKAWAHGMNTFNPSVSDYPSSRTHAFNVRCIKD
jgi:uncharacterized protein (TIGR02145 family)